MRTGTLILIAALALVPASARAVAPDTLETEGPGTLEFTPLPDEPADVDLCVGLGVDAIITNRPAEVLSQLGRTAAG